MIKQLHPQGCGNLPQSDSLLHHGLKTGLTGMILLRQIGDGHISAADLSVVAQHSLGVGDHIVKGDMGRNGLQPRALDDIRRLFGAFAVQAGKFHPVVAELFDPPDGAGKILLRLAPHRI